jgi:hypothetical protein
LYTLLAFYQEGISKTQQQKQNGSCVKKRARALPALQNSPTKPLTHLRIT